MVASIPAFSPYVTTSAAGSFNTTSNGLWQGMPLDDPTVRNLLAGGILSTAETLPMWGGVAISEAIPGVSGGPAVSLGGVITRATSITSTAVNGLTGFSVFSQNYAAVNSPQSPVPLTPSGGLVNFYRLGSGARIPVACDPNLVDLEGSIIGTTVSWDWQNQVLVPYAVNTISSGTYPDTGAVPTVTGTYTSATGVVSLTTSAAHGLVAGDSFTLAAMTGTNAATYLDGTFVATTGTAASTLNFAVATGLTLTITGGTLSNVGVSMVTGSAHGLLPGDTFELTSMAGATPLNAEWTAATGTTGTTLRFVAPSGLTATISTGVLATGGILPVKVLGVEIGNSGVVQYNSTTGFYSWNRSGSCAIILI
jgi:uncharacterized membrane protein